MRMRKERKKGNREQETERDRKKEGERVKQSQNPYGFLDLAWIRALIIPIEDLVNCIVYTVFRKTE